MKILNIILVTLLLFSCSKGIDSNNVETESKNSYETIAIPVVKGQPNF